MALDPARKFVVNVDGLKTSMESFALWKRAWKRYSNPAVLAWDRVRFVASKRPQVPDAPGIYTFVVRPSLPNFIDDGYVMYIGQTGAATSAHTLRERFGDYLREKRDPAKRPGIVYLLNKWSGHIYFCFAQVDTSIVNLKALERDLNDAILPPFTKLDFSAEIRQLRNAMSW